MSERLGSEPSDIRPCGFKHGDPLPDEDTEQSVSRTVIIGFSDPIKGRWCELAVPDGGRVYPSEGEPKIGVDHPDCDNRADLSVELDCFYCPKCGWSGRISGAWAVDVIESCRS